MLRLPSKSTGQLFWALLAQASQELKVSRALGLFYCCGSSGFTHSLQGTLAAVLKLLHMEDGDSYLHWQLEF